MVAAAERVAARLTPRAESEALEVWLEEEEEAAAVVATLEIDGMAALTRWTGGRFPRAFEFIQGQRRRQILITQMAELLKDFDMYVPGTMGGYDVGLHAQTGHPCAVVPYKFDSPPAGRGGCGRGGAPDTTANRPPDPVYNQQPICAVLCGNLYNDDKILSVAHVFQTHTAWHLKHPTSAVIPRSAATRDSPRRQIRPAQTASPDDN